MALLTLNLHKRLDWYRSEAERFGVLSTTDAIDAIAKAPEGAELTLGWEWDSVVLSGGDDGPKAMRPLPSPSRIAASGFGAPGATEADSLEPGKYLFIQVRKPTEIQGVAIDAWLADSIEWFAREAWWTKAGGEGELTLRLVHEDGKTAVQLLRALGEKSND